MKVSVVVPTVGRPTLAAAIESVLAQSFQGALEVIIVVDTSDMPRLISDERVRVFRVGPYAGANAARQRGIDAASGDFVALLDDDDTWHVDKLERQLAHVARYIDLATSDPWVSATSVWVTTRGRTRVWPRTVITPQEDYADYMFRLRSPRMGGSFVQTSTLLMPRWVACDAVRFDSSVRIHDDLGWMLDFRRTFPGARIMQTSEPLVIYGVAPDGVSRGFAVEDSVQFGRTRLGDRPDLLADFLLTFPLARAAAIGDHRRVRELAAEALRTGRPSWPALSRAAICYAQAASQSLFAGPREAQAR